MTNGKIVIGLDGSRESLLAANVGIVLAKQYAANLIVVHALLREASLGDLQRVASRGGFLKEISDDFDKFSRVMSLKQSSVDGSEIAPQSMVKKVAELLLKMMQAKALKNGLKMFEPRLVDGNAAQSILDCAETESAGLIIVGSRGLNTIERWLLGSVSKRVLHESKCPCMVVKTSEGLWLGATVSNTGRPKESDACEEDS